MTTPQPEPAFQPASGHEDAPVSHEFPVYARLDLEITSGEGVQVTAKDGRRFIDFYGGHAVAALGYGHPELLKALKDQSAALLFQTNLVPLEVREAACKSLADFAPAGLDRVFFVNSGAEANENALRIAFRQTKRSKAVTLAKGFHGRTAAAAAVTDGSARWSGFPRTPFDSVQIAPNDTAALEATLDEDVACLILEPVMGMAGALDLDTEFLRMARALTAERGILLIADEVQCGMGRCGHPFAIEAAGVVPDLLTTAKGLGGGFPVGAVLASEALANTLKPGDLGTTFGGGPLAAAMVQAVVKVLSGPGFLDNVRAMGERIAEHCMVGPVVSIQGQGLLRGLRCSRPAKEVLPLLRDRGILAGGASDPMVIRLMPPLTINAQHVDQLRDALAGIGH